MPRLSYDERIALLTAASLAGDITSEQYRRALRMERRRHAVAEAAAVLGLALGILAVVLVTPWAAWVIGGQ